MARFTINPAALGIVAKAVLTSSPFSLFTTNGLVTAKINNLLRAYNFQGNDVKCISLLEYLLTRALSLLY
jgi:hypothetical protein